MNTKIAVILVISQMLAQIARGDERSSAEGAAAKATTAPVAAESAVNASVIVTTLKGETLTGSVDRWRPSVGLVIRNEKGIEIEIENGMIDLVRVKSAVVSPASGDWDVATVGGSRLTGSIAGGDGERIRFSSDSLGETLWAIDAIRSISRRGISIPQTESDSGDRIVLRNGDSVAGTISGIDQNGVTVAEEEGEAEDVLKWGSVASVQIGSAGEGMTGGAGGFRVRLADGGELAVKAIEWENGAVELTLSEGSVVGVPASRIVSIESAGGGRVWLSGLQPASYESIPFFSTTWPLRMDVNAVEGPLRVAGTEYGRGLGMHSACKATWRLDGKYSRLTGLVGIDDSGGRLADADFLIRAGSVVLFEAKRLRHGEPAKAVDLDVKDLAEITIDVGFGKNGDVQDRVDFVNAALKR